MSARGFVKASLGAVVLGGCGLGQVDAGGQQDAVGSTGTGAPT